jgi:rhodanese-related sulfurtransferase
MITSKKHIIIIISSIIILFHCCIDDNITSPLTGDLNPTAEMLVYFEEQGDFVNSYQAPALVNAEEVYTNLSSYLIIDIRQSADFSVGHIDGSVNVPFNSLYNYFNNLNTTSYAKIILVSKNGQSSAYFTCLLRLAGFDNTYTMNFGLAAWNEYFADEWLNAIGNDPNISNYTNDALPKNNFTTLPEVTFENQDVSIEDRVKGRIRKIISEGFSNGIHYRNNLLLSVNDYLVCYGIGQLYYAPHYPGPGHNPAAVFYLSDPAFELRAQRSLQR